jgi:hypothetical protein
LFNPLTIGLDVIVKPKSIKSSLNKIERFNKSTMKVLLDIKDSKAPHLLEVLKGLSYVKTKTISNEKALLMEEIKEAVEEVKLIRQGKLSGITAKQLLDEL